MSTPTASAAPGTAVDETFAHPFIDVDEWRESPTRHRYVHGGFDGTETLFSLYLPPADAYEGRFFQYITPVPDSETVSQSAVGEEDRISFSIESGAYFVETNGGGPGAANPFSGVDPSIGAYRANAATAGYSRVVAAAMYGEHRPFGYAFGGSGGGFRTIGGAENTTGVWDGTVPYVIGSPLAIPNCFTARMHALRVLRDRFDGIVDALEPGGSGDPYAGLDDEERAALVEVTRMGFPPRSWFAHRTMGMHGLAALYPGVRAIDPGYFDEFWTVPGYLGADPTGSLLRDRVQHRTSVAALLSSAALAAAGHGDVTHAGTSTGSADDAWLGTGGVEREPVVAVRLASAPAVDPQAAELVVEGGLAAGSRIIVLELVGDVAILGPTDAAVLDALRVGDALMLDNSGFLAMQTYHRHQVPGPEFAAWDQFRAADGEPLHPQRPFLVGPIFAAGAAGSVQSGDFAGRMIVVECLLDREAYAWQADWYRSKVREHLGDAIDDRFRLWMVDKATHGDSNLQEHARHTVSYLGVLHQALRDLSAWVERGVEPPRTTSYEVVDSQIVVPATAGERLGVQPVATLLADGGERTDVRVGDEVELRVVAETPGVGEIVAVEWSVDGSGDFVAVDGLVAAARVTEHLRVRFDRPGVYFPTVRVTARRDGGGSGAFARLANITSARVVVR